MALSLGDRKVGAALMAQGILSDSDMQKAVLRQEEVGGRLADILVDLGLLSERRIALAIETALGTPLVDLLTIKPNPEALAILSGQVAQSLQVLPFDLRGETLRVAMVDPFATMNIETLEDDTGYDIEPFQGLKDEVAWAIAHYYPELGLKVEKPLQSAGGAGNDPGQLGQRLLARGWVNQAQLDQALNEHMQNGGQLGHLLMNRGYINEDQLYTVLSEQAGVPYVQDVSTLKPKDEALAALLRADAVKLSAVPVAILGDQLQVVTSDLRQKEAIEALAAQPVTLMLARPADISTMIDQYYPQQGRLGEEMVKTGKLSREQLREVINVQKKEGNKDLSEVIMELGFANEEDVSAALQSQNSGGARLEDTLVQSGKLSPEMLARSLAAQMGYEYLDAGKVQPDGKVALLIKEDTARRYGVFPIRLEGEKLVVAMKDPRNVFALDDIQLMTGREIIPAVMPEKDITRLIEKYFGSADMAGLSAQLAEEAKARDAAKDETADLSAGLDDNAVVRTVDNIIREAALMDVSDIHIEPTEQHLNVRYRIDGTLRQHMQLPRSAGASILARLKIIGALDIAERRVPQDGRIRFKKGSIDIDLRLSTLPTVYGEKAVMRLLQKASNIPEVEQLGFSEYNYQRYTEVIERPNGIFLVTGPTGSGKSFTCFSTLKRIAKPEKNTTTIEDPIEYEVPGIVQSQVNNAAGMTFARALRAFLRQDPDIIFVGEIRDQETAKIAVEAALTGHLVLATLHTNDAPGAVTRLEEMGIEDFNIAAAVVGVLAQRLVRRVCSECKQPTQADPDILRRLGLTQEDIAGATLMRGAGCPRCGGTGYKGRMGIHELMVLDEPLRRAIGAGKPSAEVKDVAIEKSGMKTLRQDGLEKALAGITTLEEVLAITA